MNKRGLDRRSGLSRGEFLRRVGGGVATIAVAGGTVPERLLGAVTPPSGLTAIALDSSVVLAWQPVAGAGGYAVLRGAGAANPTTVISGPGGVSGTSFTDSSASNGSTYSYAVQAISGGTRSAGSNLAKATPLAGGSGSGNAVAVENSFPGTTAWKMQGAAQPPTGIEGFATQTSINAGDSVDLKVNSADGVPYHIEIYRTGYYGGTQARLISVLTGLRGVGQDNPHKDPDLGLIDASNWSVTSTLTTTPDGRPGCTCCGWRGRTTRDNHIILVVREDGAGSDVVYALPVTTYQAYNKWGGRSLYTFNSSGDPTVSGSPRAVKVSFDRPYNQSLDGLNNWYTACDIQNVSWLEQQGYDVTYQTNLDVHTGSTLTNHSVYVSPAHDEYWSSEMRSAVTSARDSGVGLFFLGANGVYWKIRFEQNPFSGAQNRIQVCYKTTESGPADPSGTPTTTWRDPAGPGQPENGLIGQMYIGDNGSVFFPLVVSAAQGKNRIWRYTTLASLAPNTTSKIGKNLVGWEWDGRYPTNGSEPAGLVAVSGSPVSGELIQDAGSTFTNGPATASSTVYRTGGGTWVFATGTNQWSRGLGVNMSGVGEPSSFIQQATVNMLQDMHARPTTPAAGLVLDQLGAAQLVSTTPADGVSGAGVAAPITAKFDRALDPASVTAQTFTLTGPGGAAVQATVAYADSTHTVSLTPAQPLAVGATYTATLTTGILAIDDTPLPAPITWSFTTVVGPFSLFAASLTPVSLHDPVKDGRAGNGPFSYEMGVKVQVLSTLQLTAIRFFKDVGETGTHVGRVWNSSGQVIASQTFTGESASGWQQQSLGSPLTLQPGQVYTVSVGLNAFFVVTQLGLQAQITSGALQSVADGKNGVFGAAAGVFPTSTYKSSNYFVDVVTQLVGPTASPPVRQAGDTQAPVERCGAVWPGAGGIRASRAVAFRGARRSGPRGDRLPRAARVFIAGRMISCRRNRPTGGAS